MTLKALTDRLYHQLDLAPRYEAKDRALILKALQGAQLLTHDELNRKTCFGNQPKKRRKK